VALKLVRSLGVICGILLIYNLCVAWLWHQIGYTNSQSNTVGWLTMFFNNLVFPAFFILMIYKHRPKKVSGWWTLCTSVVCWVPLIINIFINHKIYVYLTGLYKALMSSTVAGAKEGIAVHQLLMDIQFIWITLFISLCMVCISLRARQYG
jgi:hypothetical protein